jgi:hypothetical protein
MSNKIRQQFVFFSSEREDEYDEDIDNYDNELFNVYDDGISLKKDVRADEMDDDDDELMEDDDLTLPLFDEEELDEFADFDDIDD